MITAADVYKRMEAVSEVSEAALDAFIEEVIAPKFEDAQTNMIVLTTSMFSINPLFAEKIPVNIIKMFSKRGFRMEFKIEDRACGDCHYELEIPPQGDDVRRAGLGQGHSWNT